MLRLFGHPVLERDGAVHPLPLPPKALVLTAMLAANASRPLARDWLAAKLWPDADPEAGRANLRRHLHLVNKTLGNGTLLLTRHTVQWNAASPEDVDLVRFDACAAAQPARALDEYGGELCAGIDDEALEDLRPDYRARYERLLGTVLQIAREEGDEALARRCLARLIALDPFGEQPVREMMQLRAEAGDRSGAIHEYTALRGRLTAELGVEPQAETEALFRALLEDEARPGVPNNLIPPTTSFVGREREIERISAALRECRSVTLSGPGGIGKTRLAMRYCSDMLACHPDGVWFVDLEHARSEPDVWERIGDAAGAPSAVPRNDAVLRFLEEREALVVLDTCEHLLDAARSVVERLLSGTRVRVLATSRRALGAPDERVLPVPALDVPPADISEGDSPLRYSACRLFAERAALANAGFRVERKDAASLSALLHSVDGMPLAIELIASRANVLSVEGLRKRVAQAIRGARAGDPRRRNRTLFATLEWSYDMLAPDRQAAFVRLGAFQGAFSLEDAERVCGSMPHTAEALFELVEASLVSVVGLGDEPHYRLLETTRVFAWDRLRASDGFVSTLRAHALRFMQKADALAAAPETSFAQLLPEISRTMPDYLAALDNAAAYGWGDTGVSIITGLYRFAMGHHFTEELLERGVAFVRSAHAAPRETAIVARWVATIADTGRHYDLAVQHAEIAERYAREAGDEQLLCASLTALAGIAFHRGNPRECERLLLEVRERVARSGDERQVLRITARLGTLYIAGDYERTAQVLVPAAERLIAIGEVRQAAYAFRNAAVSAYIAGRYPEARALAGKALDQARVASDLGLEVVLLTMRGCVEHLLGDPRAAVDFHTDACEVLARIGESMEAIDAFEDMALTLTALGAPVPAARLAGYAGRMRSLLSHPMGDDLSAPYKAMMEALGLVLGPALHRETASGAACSFDGALALARQELQAAGLRLDNEDTTSLS